MPSKGRESHESGPRKRDTVTNSHSTVTYSRRTLWEKSAEDEEKTRKGNKLRMIMKISPLLMTPGRCYLMMLHFVVAPSSLWSLTVGKQKGEEKKMKEEKK
ncbi:hypothetical protein AAZX31_07G207500 [Glycine max]